jgi:hypothetical protein
LKTREINQAYIAAIKDSAASQKEYEAITQLFKQEAETYKKRLPTEFLLAENIYAGNRKPLSSAGRTVLHHSHENNEPVP